MKLANGTLINDRAILAEIELANGDEVAVGHFKLLFSSQEFADREIAMAYWRQRAERGKPTLKS